MQPSCTCPVCGHAVESLPVTILPERGMVIANGKFAILPAKETLLLQRLAEVFPRVLSKEAAVEWMYQFAHEDEQPEIKIIDVFICKMRKQLSGIGLRVDTIWGKGYALALEQKPVIARAA
jgi:two-component system cell cycle response regulator CtrA